MAITSIILMVMISMLTMQAKESRALGEKLASMDFERFVISTIGNPATRNALFHASNLTAQSVLTFDSTPITPTNPYIVNLNAVAGVSSGGLVSPMSSSTLIQGIQLKVTGPTTADLLISLDQTKLVRTIHDLSFPLHLQSIGPLNSTSITGCQAQVAWPSGSFCIIQSQATQCPAGFSSPNLTQDISALPTSITDLLPPDLLIALSSVTPLWALC